MYKMVDTIIIPHEILGSRKYRSKISDTNFNAYRIEKPSKGTAEKE